MADTLAPGDVVLVKFPSHNPRGHEQEGLRPAIIICVPSRVRYPVLLIVPVTTQKGRWQGQNPATYPTLPAGAGGLKVASTVLLDQLRSIDVTRLGNYLGTLSEDEYQPIKRGLEGMCDKGNEA